MKREPSFRLAIEIGIGGESYVDITGIEGLRAAIALAEAQPADRKGMVLAQIVLEDCEAEDMETYALPAATHIQIDGAFIPHEAAIAFIEMLRAVPEPVAPAGADEPACPTCGKPMSENVTEHPTSRAAIPWICTECFTYIDGGRLVTVRHPIASSADESVDMGADAPEGV